jgi:hypothetical protein
MSTAQIVLVVVALSIGVAGLAFGVIRVASTYKAGIGPPVRGPRLKTEAGKGRLNDYYSSHDWPKPYDNDGNYIPENVRRQQTSRSES